jgi:uncharacterized protein (DUF58 family)
MPYILALVIVAIAVVLGIFTGIWGGLAWIVVAGAVLAAVFAVRARQVEVDRSATGPTGRTRAASGPGSGTANERVGQG